MTGGFKVGFHGMTELQDKALRLAKKDIRKAGMVSVEATCRVCEKRVKVKFSGDPIHVRSGLTRQSIRTDLRPARLEGAVGSSMKHVKTLEDGATIVPKNAKVLTIPLAAALTAAGKSRGDARTVGKKYAHTFWMKKKGARNPILYGVRAGTTKATAGPQLVPLFVGVKKVKIRGRHVFKDEALQMGAVFITNATNELAKVL